MAALEQLHRLSFWQVLALVGLAWCQYNLLVDNRVPWWRWRAMWALASLPWAALVGLG